VALTSSAPSVTGVNFYLTRPTFSIGGFVSDNGNLRYTVTLTDTTTGATQIFMSSKSGSYSFTNLTAGDTYTVSITSSGIAAPPSYTNTDLMTNITTDNFRISST
jgi:hypothetical protein